MKTGIPMKKLAVLIPAVSLFSAVLCSCLYNQAGTKPADIVKEEIKKVDNFKLSYQVGTVNWNGTVITRGNDSDFNAALDTLQGCGIEEVMLSGYTDVEKADFDMLAETKRIGDILRSRGMKASQHHGVAASFAPVGTSQSEVVKKLIRAVQYTANLNADVLVIHSGRLDIHFGTTAELIEAYNAEVRKHGADAVIRTCAENLRVASEYAKQCGVRIALENDVEATLPMGTIEFLPRLIREIDSPYVGVCLDSGHAHCHGPGVVKWIDTMGEKIFTTHFHDNRGAKDEHLPPGFGTIPWIDVIQALRRVGYQNAVTFESGGWVGMEAKDGILPPSDIGELARGMRFKNNSAMSLQFV